VVIVGRSGSGKTTLLRCVNFLERPDAGHVHLEGRLIGEKLVNGRYVPLGDKELAAERTQMGIVFQRFNLWPHLTALRNVALGPRKVLGLSSHEAQELAREQLAKVGLADKSDEYPERLSGGQQQRVAIARALAMRPKLLLFDEPTSSLDPELIGEVLAVMRSLAREGRTMVVVSHEMQFAADVADRVVFMEDGRIIEDAPPSEILQGAEHPRLQTFFRQITQR
jgi:ABC-type polar amino acid transport system ATPase subunit